MKGMTSQFNGGESLWRTGPGRAGGPQELAPPGSTHIRPCLTCWGTALCGGLVLGASPGPRHSFPTAGAKARGSPELFRSARVSWPKLILLIVLCSLGLEWILCHRCFSMCVWSVPCDGDGRHPQATACLPVTANAAPWHLDTAYMCMKTASLLKTTIWGVFVINRGI